MKILSIKSKTAKKLGEILNLPVIKSLDEVLEPETIIRWGSRKYFNGNQINTAEAIEKASNKILCRKLLEEARLPVPTLTETDFPVIGRPPRHHSGHGFYVCYTPRDVLIAKRKGAIYFSKFYPKQNEYRVHVAGGKCILMSIKEGNKNKFIWNKRKNGFWFRHMRRSDWLYDEQLMDIVRTAKEAIKMLGLDFGAVDILADAEDGQPDFVICEINTAPALSPLALSKYAKYFKRKLGIDY
ncbi:hypothetical protein M0R04_14370 [Candidatus Dojkabacteria bacterium]|jgi:hypothetical protein|nr:hypothetical protein [Candidatus Dojkabacteria bacterium]